MKSITKFLVCATLGLGGLTAQAHAASGDSTVSLGFAHLQLIPTVTHWVCVMLWQLLARKMVSVKQSRIAR